MLYSKSRSYHPSSPPHGRPEGGTQRSAADTQQSLPVFGQYKTAAFPLIKSTFSRHSAGCWDSAKPNLDPDDQWSPQSARRIMDSKNYPQNSLRGLLEASKVEHLNKPKKKRRSHGPTLPSPSMSIKLISLCAWHLSTYFNCFMALSGGKRPIMTHTHHLSSPHFHPFSMPPPFYRKAAVGTGHSSHLQYCMATFTSDVSWDAWIFGPVAKPQDLSIPEPHSLPPRHFAPFRLPAVHFCKQKKQHPAPWSNDPRRLWRIWFVSNILSDSVCCMLIIFSQVSAPSMLAARILGETFGHASLRSTHHPHLKSP